jgi:hypothetical protein
MAFSKIAKLKMGFDDYNLQLYVVRDKKNYWRKIATRQLSLTYSPARDKNRQKKA